MADFMFTHGDLDGVACAVLAKMSFPGVEIKYVDYTNIDFYLDAFIRERENTESVINVYITDICPETEDGHAILDILDEWNSRPTRSVYLCDHHNTAKETVNKYKWAQFDNRFCGAEIFFTWLQRKGYRFIHERNRLEAFVQAAGAYDNWKLDHPLRKRGEDMNRWLHFIGNEEFVEKMFLFPDADKSLRNADVIEQLVKNEEYYVKKILNEQCCGDFVRHDKNGNKYALLVAEKYASQVCHGALDRFSEIDYAVNINIRYKKVDLRSRKDGFDVSEVAKRMGGGGRQSTAGFVKEDSIELLANSLKDM